MFIAKKTFCLQKEASHKKNEKRKRKFKSGIQNMMIKNEYLKK